MKQEKWLVSESTECEFKESLEIAKPKSWLKTVSAFANGLGGCIYFGVNDEHEIIGLPNIQQDADKISNFIKTKIDPIVVFELTPISVAEKDILKLEVKSGTMTPYFYVNEGTRITFVRLGNESVIAPSYLLNELTLKGQKLSFDALSTKIKFEDASFTLFSSIYKRETKKSIQGIKDYISFGMADENGFLTYAGQLLSDECRLLQSRIFCTRWTGKTKGSLSLNAIDDKEYSGNIISLLKDACAFVKNNSTKSWKIEGLKRKEFIEYPEDAVREAIVNALVHRDYSIIGSEIHIDMYDDRLEVVSPGGMYDGRKIQELDIDKVASIRRNPIIADILSRIDYMERRGSGLKRIKEAYEDENMIHFFSDQHNFFVTLKKMHFDEQKLQDEQPKLQDEQPKLQDEQQKLQDEQPKLQDDDRKLQVIKIKIQESLKNTNKGNVKNKSIDYLLAIYHEYVENSCFGRRDISKLLHVSPDRASQIIKIMLDAKLIEKAKGKGMYKLNS